MTAAELRAAIAIAAKLPRPLPVKPPSKPASASDSIVRRKERAKRLEGYGKRRGPKGRKNRCAPLACYPLADWWRRAVEKALTTPP